MEIASLLPSVVDIANKHFKDIEFLLWTKHLDLAD